MSPDECCFPDLDAYRERARTGKCSVRGVLADDPAFSGHRIVYEAAAVAFPNRRPTQHGYTLVVPKEHKEQATTDFTVDEYLILRGTVSRIAEAVRGAERMSVVPLGSNQGNAHVHRHVVPLPPGTPPGEQQFAALAARIGRRMENIP